jgi:hypothetical protein
MLIIIPFLFRLPFFGLGAIRFHQKTIPSQILVPCIDRLYYVRYRPFLVPLPFFGLGAVQFHQKTIPLQISPCIDRLSASLPINYVRYHPFSLPSSILWFGRRTIPPKNHSIANIAMHPLPLLCSLLSFFSSLFHPLVWVLFDSTEEHSIANIAMHQSPFCAIS